MKEECVRRDTRQRRAVLQALEIADRPLSPQEILEAAQKELPKLGIATVYRSVKAMVEDGQLEPVELPGEGQRYEIAGKEHHHHFHCTSCGKVFELEGCSVEESAIPPDFEVEDHYVVLSGKCADCKSASHRRQDVIARTHSHAHIHAHG